MRMATTHWAVSSSSSRFCLGRGRGVELDRAASAAASCRIRSERFAAKCRRCVRVMAAAEDPAKPEMSFESALELLGVRESASFDEILQAKKALMDKSSGDEDRALQVEAAYDALLMRRLMKRRAGEVVDSTVLYADVRKRRSPSSSASKTGGAGLNWLKGALTNIPVTLEAPASSLLVTQTAVYGGLVAWTYFSGMDSPSSSGGVAAADSTGVTLAIGFGASLYFLRQQTLKLGKAAAITTAGLVAGAVVGNVLESWLRVDIVPVAGISSPAVMGFECFVRAYEMPDEELLPASIPALDFRSFDQDELLRLAKGYREDSFDPVSPSIDRSLFNESASSKMQTFQSMCDDDSSEDRGGGGGGDGKDDDISEVCVTNKSGASWRECSDRQPPGEAEVLGEHILEMQGTWISASRQEKVVAAKGFPEGWTVIVRLRWRDERCYLEFRDYTSPDGRSWPSFKAAASHLISNLDNMDLPGMLDSNGKTEVTEEKEISLCPAGGQGDARSSPVSGHGNSPRSKEKEAEQDGEAEEFVDIESGNELNENTRKRKRKQKKLDEILQERQQENVFHVANGDTEQQQKKGDAAAKVAEMAEQDQTVRDNGEGQAQQSCDRIDTASDRDHSAQSPQVKDRYVCEGCGKTFSSKSQYWGHQSSHAKKRRHKDATTAPAAAQVKKEEAQMLCGWLDEGCQECKIAVLGSELSICSWCEKEYHLSCVGKSAGEVLPPDWTCPACILV